MNPLNVASGLMTHYSSCLPSNLTNQEKDFVLVLIGKFLFFVATEASCVIVSMLSVVFCVASAR